MKLMHLLTGSLLSILSLNTFGFECSDHLMFGQPGSSDKVMCRDGYAVGYNFEHKSPEWVAYKLTRDSVSSDVVKRSNSFTIDREVPNEFRARHVDYKGSGYDRGHLAPASSMDYSSTSMKESFLLSNMVPQKPNFNRYGFGHQGVWGILEKYERSWAISRDGIYVVTGPVYASKTKTKAIGNGIEVPSHFYKVIYDPEFKTSISFLIPHLENTADRLNSYVTTIDCIESVTGFDFLNKIESSDEDDIENGIAYDFKHWAMRDNNTTHAQCDTPLALAESSN